MAIKLRNVTILHDYDITTDKSFCQIKLGESSINFALKGNSKLVIAMERLIMLEQERISKRSKKRARK